MLRQAGVDRCARSSKNIVTFPHSANCGGVRDMERLNQFAFYRLAKDLGELASYDSDTLPSDVFFDLLSAKNAVTALLEGKPVPLGVSKPAAESVAEEIQSVVNEFLSIEDESGNRRLKYPESDAAVIPGWRFGAYTRALVTFETVFSEVVPENRTGC